MMQIREMPAVAVIAGVVLVGLFTVAPCRSMGEPTVVPVVPPDQSAGMAAIEQAARDNKYLFIFFWKDNDEHARNMERVFKAAMAKMAESADLVFVRTTDPAEKPIVDKFGVSRAPMPLVVAVAPNGAVTKGFPVNFTEEQLREAFVSPSTARCLKAIQERKLVLLCIQNHRTRFSQAAWKGVQDFRADARFADATEVVTLNPSDQTESVLLRELQVDRQTPTAVTVLLAPPGAPIAKFVGAVTKEQLVAKVTSAQSGPCAGGRCGPGGCCGPKKEEVQR